MSALRVAFEETVLELDASGTARAVRELGAALAAREDVALARVRHPGDPARGGRVLRGLDRELRWFGFALDRRVAATDAQLLHCAAAIGPARGQVPLVVTINDVLALEHPRWFSRANALQQRLLLGRLARRARAVMVPSGATRDALLERVEGVEAGRVHVVPYGVGAPFSPGEVDGAVLERLGVRAPYVLTVATLQPRKNLEAALVAHERLGGRAQLVVAGGRGWGDEALAARLAGVSGVVATGRVSDEDLVALLRGAACLVHPSRHEGFGFPPLEAMACGTPVVAVEGGSVPELVGDAGVVVAEDELAEAIGAVLDDPGDRAARGLERARALTWEACAAGTVAVYRQALEG